MRYKLTQLKNIDGDTRCHINFDVLVMGGAIAAHQAGILDLQDHLHFVRKKSLWQNHSPFAWCIAELGDDE